jgi:hypothetical protein
MRTLALLLASGLVLGATLRPASDVNRDADRDAVAQAAYDYVDALYLVDPARVERSVHPDLTKRGYWRGQPGQPYEELHMSYDELRDLAARWNADGRVDPATAPREVVVLEVLDQTAAVRLTAAWGVDYLHLAKLDGRWQIVHVLWQTPPPAAP